MRRLIFSLILLAACRKTRPVQQTELPPPSAPTTAQPAAEPAAPEAANPTAAPAPPPPVETGRTKPPELAEVRPLLTQLFPAIKACVQKQNKFDAAAVKLELQVRVEPAGEVMEAGILGLPAARDCAIDVMKKLRLPAWNGTPTIIVVPLTGSGDPQMSSGDGGT